MNPALVVDPVERVARRVVRSGVVVSTVVAAGNAETVTFTADELAWHGFEVDVVLGDPRDVFNQHRAAVARAIEGAP